jgi:cell division protein YceG involved in septum cleavage
MTTLDKFSKYLLYVIVTLLLALWIFIAWWYYDAYRNRIVTLSNIKNNTTLLIEIDSLKHQVLRNHKAIIQNEDTIKYLLKKLNRQWKVM